MKIITDIDDVSRLVDLIWLGLFILFLMSIPFIFYYSTCKRAEVLNQLNNTSYTCSQFFWAEDYITWRLIYQN